MMLRRDRPTEETDATAAWQARAADDAKIMSQVKLFSNQPFVTEYGGQFAFIRPNHTQRVELPADQQEHTIHLPEELARQNVMIEVVGGPLKRAATYFSNSLDVRLMETDLRGRFDDASVSGDQQAGVREFAILILSDEYGAVVREAPASETLVSQITIDSPPRPESALLRVPVGWAFLPDDPHGGSAGRG